VVAALLADTDAQELSPARQTTSRNQPAATYPDAQIVSFKI